MSGLDFIGGRPPRSDEERFAWGYLAGRADAMHGHRATWRVQGIPDQEHRRRVPFYHAGYMAAVRDLAHEVVGDDVNDVHAAWWRYQTEQAATLDNQ